MTSEPTDESLEEIVDLPPQPADEEPEQPAETAGPTAQILDCEGADSETAIEAAREAIARGECIVLPTDTVYGIGADAFDAAAVQRLLDAKQRGRDMPPPVLISEPAVLMALATGVPQAARDLVEAYWPGPLTVICTAQPSLRMDLGETAGTIAVRVPDHEAARAVLRRTGPLAVSSANLSGQPAATTAVEAHRQLGESVAVYLDAGETPGGVASTIVDFTTAEAGVVVREGVLSVETLRLTVPALAVAGEQPEPADEPQPDPDESSELEPVLEPESDPALDEDSTPESAVEEEPTVESDPASDLDPESEPDPEPDPPTASDPESPTTDA